MGVVAAREILEAGAANLLPFSGFDVANDVRVLAGTNLVAVVAVARNSRMEALRKGCSKLPTRERSSSMKWPTRSAITISAPSLGRWAVYDSQWALVSTGLGSTSSAVPFQAGGYVVVIGGTGDSFTISL